jgi:hypothetical protein
MHTNVVNIAEHTGKAHLLNTPMLRPLITETEIAFAALIAKTEALCMAERDIAGLDAGDPAFDQWFRDAERARAATIAAADAVIMCMTVTAADRRFRIVARNFEAMLLTQDAKSHAFVSEALMSTAWFYNVAGRGPRAARATGLLRQFRHLLGLLLSMPDYTPEPGVSMPAASMAA